MYLKKISFIFPILLLVSCVRITGHPFSPEEWKKENNYIERYRMIPDFANRYDIRGWKLDDVIALLGDPDVLEKILLETYPTQFGGYLVQYYVDSGTFSGVREALEITTNNASIVNDAYYSATNGSYSPIYKEK